MKISVKIGSNQVNLNITRTTCCGDLIRKALMECKIAKSEKRSCFHFNDQTNDKIVSNYCLIERAAGIERIVKNSENIILLLNRLNKYDKLSHVQLIIKLCSQSKSVSKRIQASNKLSKRLFQKYKKTIVQAHNHTYEQIDYSLIEPKIIL